MEISRREALKTAAALGVGAFAGADAVPATTPAPASPQPTADLLAGSPLVSHGAAEGEPLLHALPKSLWLDGQSTGQPLCALVFSPDSTTLAAASCDGSLRLWDIPAAKEALAESYRLSQEEHARRMNREVEHPVDGHQVWGWGESSFAYQEARVLLSAGKDQEYLALAVAFAADDRTLATGPVDDRIQLYDLRTGKVRGSVPIPKQHHQFPTMVAQLALTADGRKLAALLGADTSGAFSTIAPLPLQLLVWDVATGKPIYTVEDVWCFEPQCLAFLPDDKTLAMTATAKGRHGIPTTIGISLLDVTSGAQRLLPTTRPDMSVTAWALSGDGTVAAMAEAGETDHPVKVGYCQIVVRKLALGGELARFEPATEYTRYVALSQDGGWLLKQLCNRTGQKTELTVCRLANRFTQETFEGQYHLVAFSPDGRRIAAAQGDRIYLWLVDWITYDGHPDAQVAAILARERAELQRSQRRVQYFRSHS